MQTIETYFGYSTYFNLPFKACVQLGFPGAKRPTHSSQFGYGLEKIWMDNMHCYGTEEALSDCRYNIQFQIDKRPPVLLISIDKKNLLATSRLLIP